MSTPADVDRRALVLSQHGADSQAPLETDAQRVAAAGGV
jgi:hypothetical protein